MCLPLFWSFHYPKSTSKCAEWAEDMDNEASVICPANPGHQRAGRRMPLLSVQLPSGTVDDVVWTWYTECLLTDRVVDLFRSQGFTGFEVKPVRAVFKRGRRRPPRLWELVVTGWAGLAPAESGVRVVKHCAACRLTEYSVPDEPGKLISPSQWDGSDLFIIWPLPAFVFVTDRVAKAILANRITGVFLKRPSELDFGGGTCGAGRLSYWMPEKRARELGEPLGIY